jgi:hypothetical protein
VSPRQLLDVLANQADSSSPPTKTRSVRKFQLKPLFTGRSNKKKIKKNCIKQPYSSPNKIGWMGLLNHVSEHIPDDYLKQVARKA